MIAALDPMAIQARGMRAFVRLIGSSSERSRLVELDGAIVAAVVPTAPDRSIASSVVYEDGAALIAGLEKLEAIYREAGVRAWTVWAPEGDRATVAALARAGHQLDGRPAAMLADLRSPELAWVDDEDFDSVADGYSLSGAGRPSSLAELNDRAYGHGAGDGFGRALLEPPPELGMRVYEARDDGGHAVSALGTLDTSPAGGGESDLVVLFVATDPAHGRRGLAASLLGLALREGRGRGCRTSSLQASAQGEPLYRRLGYRTAFHFEMYERRSSR